MVLQINPNYCHLYGQIQAMQMLMDQLEYIGMFNKKKMHYITILCMKYFRHEDRDKALHLCGWNFDSNSLNKFLEQLEKVQAFTRAAAIAVFNLKLKLAIDILNRGSDIVLGANLNVVAMALAGFSDDKNSMWRQFCAEPKSKLSDPYLRAMFLFLTAENYNYDQVLVIVVNVLFKLYDIFWYCRMKKKCLWMIG